MDDTEFFQFHDSMYKYKPDAIQNPLYLNKNTVCITTLKKTQTLEYSERISKEQFLHSQALKEYFYKKGITFREDIANRAYYRVTNQKIAWSNQVEEALGKPINTINKLQREVNNSYTQLIEINALWMREKNKIRIFNNLSFWKKFLLIFKKETVKEKING